MREKGKKRSFLRTLRGRMTLHMLLVTLVPIVVIGCLVYTTMRSSERKASDSVDDTRVALEEEVIGAKLIEVTSGFLGQVATGQAATVWKLAAVPTVVQAAESGSVPNSAADEFLLEELERSTSFDSIAITNKEGGVVAGAYWDRGKKDYYAGTAGLPASLVDSEAWQSAKENGVTVAHPIYLGDTGPTAGLAQMDFAARIEDSGTGETVGVLQFTMRGPAAGIGVMVTGRITAGKLVVFDDNTGDLIFDSSDVTRTQGSAELSDLERAVQAAIVNTDDESGFFIMGDNVATFIRLSSTVEPIYPEEFVTAFSTCGWSVMVQQPEAEAFAELRTMGTLENQLRDSTNTMVMSLGIILAVVLVVVLVVAVLLSRGITRPVTELRDAAEKISMGDISADIPAAGDDEVGDLSESFGRMVAAMRFLYEEEKERGRS